jgi:transmembrane sensor
MIDSEHIARLLFRYIRKELNAKELAELKTWREADLKNEEFFQVETDPEYIRAAYTRRSQAKEKMYCQLQKKYPGEWKFETADGPIRRLWISRIAAVLITIALLAGSYFLFHDHHHHKPGEVNDAENTYASLELIDGTVVAMDDLHRGWLASKANIRFETSPGGEMVYAASDKPNASKDKMFKLYTGRNGHLILWLPDGSHVWLNEQSSISYPPNFSGDTIKMIIKGEAYFQQAKNSKKFFTITLPPTSSAQRSTLNAQRLTLNAQRLDTIIINTSFAHLNIRSYSDEDSSKFTLLKGNASIYIKKAGEINASVKLFPGQQTIWNGVKFSTPARADIKKVMEWEKW